MKYPKIGFTGTRKGMTNKQKEIFRHLLQFFECTEFHHGSCVGADQEAGDIAKILGCKLVLHPPTNKDHMANCTGDEIREPKPYLVRDKDIVDETSLLIGTPHGFDEIMRGSGTWATIRYGRKVNTNVLIVFPDGLVKDDNHSDEPHTLKF